MSALPIPLHPPPTGHVTDIVEASLDAIERARTALHDLPDTAERHEVEVELDRLLTLLAYGPPEAD